MEGQNLKRTKGDKHVSRWKTRRPVRPRYTCTEKDSKREGEREAKVRVGENKGASTETERGQGRKQVWGA